MKKLSRRLKSSFRLAEPEIAFATSARVGVLSVETLVGLLAVAF